MRNRYTLISAIILLVLTMNSCFTNEPVLSQLYNDRITLIVKGTYESNDPYGWQGIYTDDGVTTRGINFTNNINNQSEVKWYIDLAEMRMAQGTGKPSGDTNAEYYMLFAQERQVMCSDTSALYGKSLDTCISENGTAKLNAFFGDGLQIPAVDVKAGDYNHFTIYFRKLVTWPSEKYTAVAYSGDLVTLFDNRYIYGTNIENIYQYKSTDFSTPVLFPLQRTDLSLHVEDSERPYVMEVRIFLKNLMMKHVMDYTTTNEQISFVGPSDWAANHQYNVATYQEAMGENMIFTARIYHPDDVGSIQVTSGGGANCYFAVVKSGESFDPLSRLPLAATQATNNYLIKNLPSGSYDLYKTCDTKWYKSGGLTVEANKDGYPETATICNGGLPITVTAGQVSTGGC